MIREIYENELKGLLELYLHLHESDVPEMSEHLRKTWKTIVEDKNHHIIIKVVDDKIVSSCVCVVIPDLPRYDGNFASKLNLFSYVYCDK